MQHKILETSSKDKIHIFDGVFGVNEQYKFLNFIEKSNFTFNSTSSNSKTVNYETTFGSMFNQTDLHNLGILDTDGYKTIMSNFEGYEPKRCWVTCSYHGLSNRLHTDCTMISGDRITLLYYVNIEWNYTWGGETQFCDRQGEMEIVSEYKPNRVVVFNSKIPHRPACTTGESPYRFTLVIQHAKSND